MKQAWQLLADDGSGDFAAPYGSAAGPPESAPNGSQPIDNAHVSQEEEMRLLPVVAAAAAAMLAAQPATAQRAPDPAAACNVPHAAGVSAQELTSSGKPRAYRLFVPPGYDGRKRLPLVLDMHGSGGNAAGEARTSGMEA